MRKTIISLVLGALLGNQLTICAQTPSPNEIRLKYKIVEIGTEQIVKLKLQSKETIRGRIAEIRNDSFTLQLVEANGQMTNRDIAYSQLRNVSKVSERKASSIFTHGVLQGAGIYLGMLAVSAAVFGIALAVSR